MDGSSFTSLLVTVLPQTVTNDALVTRIPSKLAFLTVNPVTTTLLRPGLSRPSM